MREQIQAYVNGLFADAALTIRNAEVRQEILQHTLDRYDDLVASGKPEQEAYDEAVAGIGDVSELYEHKPAEKQAEAPKSARDFPAPPAAPYTAPAAPAKKKKFPGWAIALICAAVVLLAVLVLNFAGAAAYTVLRTGERYIYDHAGAYETLGRSGFGSEQVMADIDEIEIHWLSGSVYLVESETDGVTFQEDYTGDVDDYRLRYAVEDGKLVIQPCRSRTFGSMDLPKKTLTVFLPKTRTLDAVTVETVSADVELHGGQTSDLSVTTTSGEIIGPGIRAGEYDLSTVSGGVRLPSLPAAGSSIDCDTVSGYMSLGCEACPADVDFDSVSGSLTLTLPAGSQYTLAFDSVSGRIITTNFTPGTAAPCAISAETVSGDLEIRNP